MKWILPRLAIAAGFELGSGMAVNPWRLRTPPSGSGRWCGARWGRGGQHEVVG
jgi:hypothetical protein